MDYKMIYTTLKILRDNDACVDRYQVLRKSLRKNQGDNTKIPLTHNIESNGLDDILWVLSVNATCEDSEGFTLRFAHWRASEVLHNFEELYPDDKRPRRCLDGVINYIEGRITKEKLDVLRDAAYSAAAAVAYPAAAAAAAAYSAAYSAVYSAAAYPAAYSTEKKKQKAKLIEMLEGK